MQEKNQSKHIYIAAGAAMMLILLLVIAAFGRSVFADQDRVEITQEQAKQIALENAGVTLEQVTVNQVKLDLEGEVPVYEIEFYTAERMWEYEINAETGVIRDQGYGLFISKGKQGQGACNSRSVAIIVNNRIASAVINFYFLYAGYCAQIIFQDVRLVQTHAIF